MKLTLQIFFLLSSIVFAQNDIYEDLPEIKQFDICSEEFFIDNYKLLDIYINKNSSLTTITENPLFGAKTKITLEWAENNELQNYLKENINNVRDVKTFDIVIKNLKKQILKVSVIGRKIEYYFDYNDCKISSFAIEEANQLYFYDSISNVLTIEENITDTIEINYSNNTLETYTNDVLISQERQTETIWTNKVYSDGVLDYIEEFNYETQKGKYNQYWKNGNLCKSGSYKSKSGPFGEWVFNNKNGTYSAVAKVEGKKIKGNAEIYKSGEFINEVNFNNKKSSKLLDYLNNLL